MILETRKPMNLFQAAQDNAEALLRRYGLVRDAAGPAMPMLDRFVVVVQSKGRLAINQRPTVLLRFLALEGGYYNVYEWADELAGRSGESREDLLRQRLKGIMTVAWPSTVSLRKVNGSATGAQSGWPGGQPLRSVLPGLSGGFRGGARRAGLSAG
jgi:hypothetical protein